MRQARAGGGWRALAYALRKSRQAGGLIRMFRALHSRNACKTCALGMGGQRGGMVNELGRFPEVCKKSIQAMAADLQGAIHERFFDDFSLERLCGFSPRELEAAGRLTRPLYAGPLDSHYRVIGWDAAMEKVTGSLQTTAPEEAFFYFSGRSSNEAGFLLQLMARLYGTNHVNNCSFYCHQASGVGLSSVIGSGTATVVLEDVEGCDLLLLLGANPASNHPRFMRSLLELKRRGGRVVVVNPLREVGLVRFKVPSDPLSLLFGSTIANVYVQPHIGGDIAFLCGVAKAVLERGAEDRGFLEACTDGWEELERHLNDLAWDDVVSGSGVPRETIEQVADVYAASGSAIFAWAMGITHHVHGTENVQMIANLALLRGMVGRPRCGLLPLRGHSNVQGIGSVGVTPQLKQLVLDRLESTYGVTLPTAPGLDTLGCLERAAAGGMRFAWCLGGNLYAATPDSGFAASAFRQIDTVVHLSTTLNTGHAWGRGRETIVLPVLPRDEEPQPSTQESMFNFVRLSEGGPARHEGPRSEVDIIATVAEAVLGADGPIDWASMRGHGAIRAAIGRIIPGYETIGRIDQTRQEFQIGGRTFHEPRFATGSGRASMHVIPLPDHPAGAEDALRLMTVRSEGQFNTVVYEEHDIYRGQERRDVIMMNQQDIARLGLTVDQPVRVTGPAGALGHVLVRPIDIPAGNAAMYFPEANALIPTAIDPKARTPTYKNVLVTVAAEDGPAPKTDSAAAPVAAGSPRTLRPC